MHKTKHGFTLLELIIVIIIIGVLATLGFTQYAMVIEKGRTAEAKTVLGRIRSSQIAYKWDYSTYSSTLDALYIGVPTACTSTHYFSYTTTAGSNVASALRCTAGGKTPNANSTFEVDINYDTGAWSGTSPYY